MVMAPIVYGRKGEHKDIFEHMRKAGYVQDAGGRRGLRSLDEDIDLDKKKKHYLSVVIDRLSVREGITQRLTDSVETALKLGSGVLEVKKWQARPSAAAYPVPASSARPPKIPWSSASVLPAVIVASVSLKLNRAYFLLTLLTAPALPAAVWA
jgi:excinuclease UvrABC ATPase subunit